MLMKYYTQQSFKLMGGGGGGEGTGSKGGGRRDEENDNGDEECKKRHIHCPNRDKDSYCERDKGHGGDHRCKSCGNYF